MLRGTSDYHSEKLATLLILKRCNYTFYSTILRCTFDQFEFRLNLFMQFTVKHTRFSVFQHNTDIYNWFRYYSKIIKGNRFT